MTKTLARRSLIIGALATAGSLALPIACAQSAAGSYPSKPIKIIVPFAAGGSVDAIARVLAERMQDHWKQPVLVESKPGASTQIGTAALASAPADGYTVMIAVSNHTTNPALRKELPYDTLKDFQPIGLIARTPIVAYANPKFPPNTLQELAEYSKTHPGPVNFGSAGAGSMTHLTAEQFKIESKIDMQHIVYKGGTPALMDVIAGHIPMTFATVGQALQNYRAGQVKPLGISSAERYSSVPDIPTFKEQGFDVVATEWFGMLAPAGTPRPIVDKLNNEIRRIIALPGLGDRLTAIELVSSTPEELGEFIKSEMDKLSPLVQQIGLAGSQ